MKFWKRLQVIGSVVIVVLGVLALVAAHMQAPEHDRPTGAPAHHSVTPHSTQGL